MRREPKVLEKYFRIDSLPSFSQEEMSRILQALYLLKRSGDITHGAAFAAEIMIVTGEIVFDTLPLAETTKH